MDISHSVVLRIGEGIREESHVHGHGKDNQLRFPAVPHLQDMPFFHASDVILCILGREYRVSYGLVAAVSSRFRAYWGSMGLSALYACIRSVTLRLGMYLFMHWLLYIVLCRLCRLCRRYACVQVRCMSLFERYISASQPYSGGT